MNKKVLEEIGMSPGEIRVYLALFELGETTVGPIAKTAKVSHAKVYPILDKLILKGLASHTTKKGTKHLNANHPSTLVDYIDSKITQLNEEKERVKQFIPELIAKQQAKSPTQQSRVFEGTKAMKALFYELFHQYQGTKIQVLGLNEYLRDNRLHNFFAYYHSIRKECKVKLQLILHTSFKPYYLKHYFPTGEYKKSEVKFVKEKLPYGMFTIGDHVIQIVAGNNITAFDIKSKENAKRHKEFFDALWANT